MNLMCQVVKEPTLCHCSEGLDPEGHYHCIECDCILGSFDDSDTTCCWCLELKQIEPN